MNRIGDDPDDYGADYKTMHAKAVDRIVELEDRVLELESFAKEFLGTGGYPATEAIRGHVRALFNIPEPEPTLFEQITKDTAAVRDSMLEMMVAAARGIPVPRVNAVSTHRVPVIPPAAGVIKAGGAK